MQTYDKVKNLQAQITERQAKHHALLTAYDQLVRQPISEFQPTQWTALIDYAIVGIENIEFFFRDGRTISIDL
ncbi:hypothetical protein RQN30_11205 [Arcanobacterium hippocoleae]